MAPLFRKNYQNLSEEETRQTSGFWKYLGKWYEEHGYIKEALLCLKYPGEQVISGQTAGTGINQSEKQLLQEGNTVCVRNTEAITCIHLVDAGEPEKLVRWLRSFAADTIEVREDNYVMLYCQAKMLSFV